MNNDWDPTDLSGREAANSPPGEAPQGSLDELLERGEMAAQAGQRTEARRLFRQALVLGPTSERAWLWLAYLAPSARQSLDYLRQAREYHPHSWRVLQAISWAEEQISAEEVPSLPSRDAEPLAAGRPAHRRPGRAARPRPLVPGAVHERPRRGVPTLGLVALALVAVALLASVAANGLRRAAGRGLAPTPVPSPSATLPSDMATLRQLASVAVEGQDWEHLVPLLERMRELAPDDEGARQQLAVAHLRFGLQLVEADRVDEAIAHYDAAIRLYANDKDLQTARRIAVGYRDGRQAVRERRWADGAALLEPVYRLDPKFQDLADLLFTAYLRQAQEADSAHRLEAARPAYARAAEIKPDDQAVQARLAEIAWVLTPPTPTPTPRPAKRIEISISQQRFRGYQNESLVFDWRCSTGEPGRPTQYGDFQVLDKIPEAWSSVWGLRMPYWLGIYWAGGSENGIHALPINRSGQQLWAGFLGSPVSFGCIILDTPNAARLYDWADIGTPVSIVP